MLIQPKKLITMIQTMEKCIQVNIDVKKLQNS